MREGRDAVPMTGMKSSIGGGRNQPRPHEQLDAWKVSVDLVVLVYEATRAFPREEIFGITSQMRRAAVSIPANIAEGSARRSASERKQFYYISRGSVSELETHITIATRLGYLQRNDSVVLYEHCQRIAAMLNGMIQR